MLGAHLVTLAAATDGAREQEVHLLPAGQFTGRDGRGPYRLDDAAAVIEATRQAAGRMKLPIDYDHAIDLAAPKGHPAPAAGWIKGLQARANGIWGLVEWTERAATLITGAEYRYLSPVFAHERAGGRVRKLMRAALTNNPNLDLVALAAQGATMDLSTELRQLLALAEDADEAAILASVSERLSAPAASVDPTKYVPIGELVKATAELARVNRGVTLQAATTTVDCAIEAGKLPPFLRDWSVNLCTVNKPAFDAFVENTAGDTTLFAALVPGVPPGGQDKRRLTADEDSIARNLGLSADEFAAARGA